MKKDLCWVPRLLGPRPRRSASIWRPVVLGLALLAVAAVGHAADGVKITRVIGTEFPGRYKHPASIEELASGDLFIAYYGGDGEYAERTAIYGMRKKAGDDQWSRPQVIADTPLHSDGNAVVWRAPDGVVWLFYVCRYGPTWADSRIKAKISRDDARSWSDSFLVTFERGMMVRNRPIVLAGGDYLVPVYHEVGEDREQVGRDSTSLFLRFDPKHKTWTESNQIRSRRGNIQPAVAAVTDNDLICFCRRGGGYGPTSDGWLVRSASHDGGRTWSEGVDSEFPNPNAAVDLQRLSSGHLLLIYNDSMTRRAPLTAALSTDGGKTFPYRRNLVSGPGPYAYPYAIESQDGNIHLVFTSDGRTVINHAVFREDAIPKMSPCN
jgi:predicted neuraminidase